MFTRPIRGALTALLVCGLLSGCLFKDSAAVPVWTDIAANAVTRFNAAAGPPGLSPMETSRIYAMAFSAMHDALNAIDRRYQPYLTSTSARGADPDAAVAQAVRDVLAAQLPSQVTYLDGELAATLSTVPDATARKSGIALGKQTAHAILDARAHDNADNAQGPYSAPNLPGVYQPTPPINQAAYVNWGKVTPFAVASAATFRAPPMYAVTDARYTADYNEIKRLGGAITTERTADQTEIARFWLEGSPEGWLRIARTAAKNRNLSGWEQARLYALLEIAIADSYITCIDAKYHYRFWRPITAITQGDADGNPATAGDPAWTPLDPVTPPIPDYPSAHASAGGAAQAVLSAFFKTDAIGFAQTSGSLPGVTRNYTSFSHAEKENADSRIFVGYHFRLATEEGNEQGERIGAYVALSKLLPVVP